MTRPHALLVVLLVMLNVFALNECLADEISLRLRPDRILESEGRVMLVGRLIAANHGDAPMTAVTADLGDHVNVDVSPSVVTFGDIVPQGTARSAEVVTFVYDLPGQNTANRPQDVVWAVTYNSPAGTRTVSCSIVDTEASSGRKTDDGALADPPSAQLPPARAADPAAAFDGVPTRQLVDGIGRTTSKRDLQALDLEILSRGDEAVPSLTDLLDEGDTRSKLFACNILGDLDAGAAEMLARLEDPGEDPKVRVRTARLLGEMGHREAYPVLLVLAESAPDAALRKSAIAGLGHLGDPAAVPTLEGLLRDPDPLVALNAAGALGLLGVDSGTALALRGAESDDFAVQQLSIHVLGLIGNRSAESKLRDIADRPQANWKSYARIALLDIELRRTADIDRSRFLGQHASDSNERVREWALRELAQSPDADALSILQQRARGETAEAALARRLLLTASR